jgi:glycosyltransferase involved in cell wall biosynthesis
VISDTGSTDNTKELITNFFKEKNIPGEFADLEWKSFGHNRSYVLNACKGKADYLWVIDADDYLEGEIVLPENTIADAFTLRIGKGPDFTWWRNQIFKVDAEWHYVGVLHEYAATNKPNPQIYKLDGNYKVNARTTGARNVGISGIEKYSKDAKTLELALIDEPDNARYWFYLAQSYFDSQQFPKSEEAYAKRVSYGGWPEEVYYSLYRIAIAKALQEKPWHEIKDAFLAAYNFRPTRAEPLFHIAQIYRMKMNMPAIAYIYIKMAADIPYPKDDILFIPDQLYNFGILDELASVAYYAGRPDVGYMASKAILEQNRAPESEIPRIQQNFEKYKEVMQNLQPQTQQTQTNKINLEKTPEKSKTYKRRKVHS